MFENKLSKLRKDLRLATIASLLSFIISLGLAPIMTRYYDPSDYGTFAIINNLATFIATAILFSLPNALPMELHWHRRAQLLRALIHLVVFAFVISGIGTIIFIGFSSLLSESDDTVWAFLLLPFLVLAIGVHRIAQGWANADGAFTSMAKARVAHPLVAKPFAISASMLTSSNPIYIVLFEIMGYFVQSYLMLRGRVKRLKGVGDFLKERRIRISMGIIRRHRDYSLYLNFVNLLALGFIMMLTIILTINYSVKETGLFTLALSMSSLPIQLIAMATASIIYHKFIQIAEKTPELLFKITLKTLLGYMVLGVIPYFVIYYFGENLFGFVFGSDWTQSGTVASLLALPLFLGFLRMPISSVFRVTKTIKLQFIIDFIFIIPIMIILYLVSLSMSFYDSLYILAWGMSLHGFTVVVCALYVTWKTSQTSLEEQKGTL